MRRFKMGVKFVLKWGYLAHFLLNLCRQVVDLLLKVFSAFTKYLHFFENRIVTANAWMKIATLGTKFTASTFSVILAFFWVSSMTVNCITRILSANFIEMMILAELTKFTIAIFVMLAYYYVRRFWKNGFHFPDKISSWWRLISWHPDLPTGKYLEFG